MKKKLWQKKYFGRLFSVFAMLLVGVCFTSTYASAGYDYVIPTFNEAGNIITIPEYSGNSILICSVPSYADTNASKFSIDNASSTSLIYNCGGNNNQDCIGINYFENPPIGIKNWSMNNGVYGGANVFYLIIMI